MKTTRMGSRAASMVRLAPALLFAALACSHAQSAPATDAAAAPAPAPEPDPMVLAAEVSNEARALLRAEGELLWQRWTSGSGAVPASAVDGHQRLYQKPALETLARARAKSGDAGEKRALTLLLASLGPQAMARGAGPSALAFEQARAQLAFAAPGDAKPERSERDLDRLLTDEASDPRRAQIADAEAAAAAPLAALLLAEEKKEEEARAELGLPEWAELVAATHGSSPDALAQLAESTLAATQEVAVRAISSAAQRNLGQLLDQLHRADLPRLVRATEADAELNPGKGWESARATFTGLGFDPLALPAGLGRLRVDSEPLPSKAARPLALLIDPPDDVRLSFKSAGGLDEQRALLHETARALGGVLTRAVRWEEAQLGDGSAAEAIAWLLESLAGDPAWLRERMDLRGEPLDDLVHTEATRRLLAARRAAALVLFEVQRRNIPQTPEAQSGLYRSLLARATLARFSERDGGRWPLEVDGWLKAAVPLRAALLGAALALSLESTPAPAAQETGPQLTATEPADAGAPAGGGQMIGTPSNSVGAPSNSPAAGWWRSHEAGQRLRALWEPGRALGAEEAAALAQVQLDPAALVQLTEERLAYRAPEKPPAAQRPDYKFMQGDRRPRRKKHKKQSN